MAPAAVQPRTRTPVIVASALAHALLVAVLLRPTASPLAQAEAGGMEVSMIDGRALAVAASSPPVRSPPHEAATRTAELKPPAPSDIEPQYVDLQTMESAPEAERDLAEDPVALSVAAASAASGTACHLTAWLQAALQADPYVQTALPLVPRRARSVANAIMLWDGGWISPRSHPAPALGAIRSALIAGIRAAPAACRAELVRGPELMILTEGGETTVLAIGSGEWRWGDLLDPAGTYAEAGTPTQTAVLSRA